MQRWQWRQRNSGTSAAAWQRRGWGAQRDGGSAVAAVRMLRWWWQRNSAMLAALEDVGADNGDNAKDKDGNEDGNKNEDEVVTKTTTRR
jgi:hypothetical protein